MRRHPRLKKHMPARLPLRRQQRWSVPESMASASEFCGLSGYLLNLGRDRLAGSKIRLCVLA
jgi:hypothetical protein